MAGSSRKCPKCGKSIGYFEKIKINDIKYHKKCAVCEDCKTKLSKLDSKIFEGKLYCEKCYKEKGENEISKSNVASQKVDEAIKKILSQTTDNYAKITMFSQASKHNSFDVKPKKPVKTIEPKKPIKSSELMKTKIESDPKKTAEESEKKIPVAITDSTKAKNESGPVNIAVKSESYKTRGEYEVTKKEDVIPDVSKEQAKTAEENEVMKPTVISSPKKNVVGLLQMNSTTTSEPKMADQEQKPIISVVISEHKKAVAEIEPMSSVVATEPKKIFVKIELMKPSIVSEPKKVVVEEEAPKPSIVSVQNNVDVRTRSMSQGVVPEQKKIIIESTDIKSQVPSEKKQPGSVIEKQNSIAKSGSLGSNSGFNNIKPILIHVNVYKIDSNKPKSNMTIPEKKEPTVTSKPTTMNVVTEQTLFHLKQEKIEPIDISECKKISPIYHVNIPVKVKPLVRSSSESKDYSNIGYNYDSNPIISRIKLENEKDICHRCNKRVYAAERMGFIGYSWHKLCLKCKSCGKALDPGTAEVINEDAYCRVCFKKESMKVRSSSMSQKIVITQF